MPPAARDAKTLAGTLERVVYENAGSHWMVARLVPDGGGEPVTAVGALVGVGPGTELVLHGAWVVDKRFGEQFRVESYQTRTPATQVGIERYLGSGLVPGIGPELAKRIVARFGLETLEVIGRDPGRLREVEGIGRQRAERIAGAWQDQRAVQDVMVFLRGHGVSAAFAARIFKRYGTDSIVRVSENPYRLAGEIWGIGFKTADQIARNLGMARDSPERLGAGIVHALVELAEDGHLHAPEGELVAAAAGLLEVTADKLTAPLAELVAQNTVVSEELGDRGTCISLAQLWIEEHAAAAALAAIVVTPQRRPPGGLRAAVTDADIEAAIARFEREAALELAVQQRAAVAAAVRDKVVVITGGPGVGKTTIVRAVLQVLLAERREVALAAPTGRAAKRLAEATGAPAQTVHRLLELTPRTGGFERNADNPLDQDVVIVDETSMVDVALLRALLVAMRPDARLVLVGDIDQLPSVGPGAVLADVIASRAAAVVRLTEIFRQAAKSEIVVSAHRVNRGEPPAALARGGPRPSEAAADTPGDFFFVERDDPEQARATVVELVADRIPRRFGFDPVTEVQVLAPMHRGELGTRALNGALQERLNPARPGLPELSRGERVFRLGDKVMQLRNDYDKDVFNGDVGVIASLREGGALAIDFHDGRVVDYERDELDQLIHAYAVSVHKAQGSEFPAVVLPLATQHYMMLQRNLLYTAITRGKKLVVVVGSRRAVLMAVRNDRTRMRWTWLAERIRAAVATLRG